MHITPNILAQIISEGVALAMEGVLDEYDLNLTEIQEAAYEDLIAESQGIDLCEDCGMRHLDEAKYKGREVKLGKPMKGDTAKFKVYVRDKKTGNVKKVNFGSTSMEIRRDNPKARKSFRARHGCGTARASDRTKAAYWSCRMWSRKPVSKIIKGK
jgi:hypothetical protein